jgi:membrane peptidoglycan carboxypeptidase
VRYSLGNSLNVTPVKAAEAVGPQKIVVEARRLGFVDTFRRDGCSRGGYGPAIATGGIDVTLDEMMYGYSVLANGGIMRGQEPTTPHDPDERPMDPVSLLKIENSRGEVIWDIGEKRREARVVEAAYTYMIWDIMTDPQAQCATFQCGGITIPGYKAAVKTGTSEPYDPKGPNAFKIGETWSFGYSPDLVVGIWAGNADNTPVSNILSTHIAFRAMRDAFTMAHQGIAVTQMVRPPEVVEAEICVPSNLKPTELCGRKTKDIFYKDKLPTQDDTWWQRVKLDNRNGKLAAPDTPPQFIEERVMLVIPEDQNRTEEDKKRWAEMAAALGLALAPTEVSDGGGGIPSAPGGPTSSSNDYAAILTPLPGTSIRGTVAVMARAVSPSFKEFRLEVGAGVNPASWSELTRSTRPVNNGLIANWDTTTLQSGIYTLRLVVDDDRLPDSIATVSVLVNNDPPPGQSNVPPPVNP